MTMMPEDAEFAAFYSGRPALITGGLGFIGSNLAIRLVNLGAKVTIVDSLIPEFGGNWFNVKPVESRLRVNISDMRDAHSLRILVRDQDVIFHLAAQVSHGDSMRDPERDLGVNCVATINLLESCRRFNPTARLVYTSTRQVYGSARVLPVAEDHPTIPIDVNGINKLAAEYYHLLYNRTYGLHSTVIRLTNTYGPRQQIRNDRQGFTGVVIRHALRGEPIEVFGTGRQIRDFNYVDDVVEALLLAAARDACRGGVYNAGAPRNYSILEFLEILNQFCPLSYEIVPFPNDRAAIDIGDYYGDYARLKSKTGWEPKIDLAAGLERTIAFYRDHKRVYWA